MIKTKHIIYIDKNGQTKSTLKDWTFEHAEAVLKRTGAKYWEVGINTSTRYRPPYL